MLKSLSTELIDTPYLDTEAVSLGINVYDSLGNAYDELKCSLKMIFFYIFHLVCLKNNICKFIISAPLVF